MYEKPQYLTPDGYKRLAKNPFKGGLTAPLRFSENRVGAKRGKSPLENYSSTFPAIKKRRGISDEAAKAIAAAIKGMLNST